MAERNLNALADEAAQIERFPDFPQPELPNPFAEQGGGEPVQFPEQMPTIANQPQGAEWPESMPGLPEQVDFPSTYPPAQEISAFPDFSQQQGTDGSTTFNFSPQEERQSGAALGFPDPMPGPQQSGGDPSLYALLQQIASGISSLTGAKSPENTGSQQYQFPWSDHGFMPLEAQEDYAAASPAMNYTNLQGARGAGGFGYGSKYGSQSAVDLLEPSRRRAKVSND
jgi:hypothetical protein